MRMPGTGMSLMKMGPGCNEPWVDVPSLKP